MNPEAYSFPWYTIPVTIASILIPVLIFVAFIYIWLKKHNEKCPHQTTNCKEDECNRLVKKNFNHLIILFVVVLVFVIVDLFIDDKNAMDYFSFASTITSIILSVLAIIMTIWGENKTEGMKRQIDDSAHKLEEAANKIQEYKAQLDQQQEIFQNILNTSQLLKKEITSIKADVKDVKNNFLNLDKTPPDADYEDESYENN